MKLSIVFPVLNQFPLARTAIGLAMANLSGERDVELIVIDNGSDIPFSLPVQNNYPQTVIRNEKSTGVYPTFWQGLEEAQGDVIAFFHSDLIVSEKGWDKRVLEEFEQKASLGLIGFVGSNEIDSAGGRGLGTTSNFQGDSYMDSDGMGGKQTWQGSKGSVHGAMNAGFTPAAVVDGCAMIFRRTALEAIPQRENFPPHHFYDKLLSCEVRERGFSMGVLGIACDHISGQTVAHEPKYEMMAREWSQAHNIPMQHNYDHAIYLESERQWLSEYRDIKHLIPCKV